MLLAAPSQKVCIEIVGGGHLIVNEEREVHAAKAKLPILVTEVPMMAEVNELQNKNACTPIESTVLGITTDVSP